jgi:transcriptional regulator with XRE-family HTH domain
LSSLLLTFGCRGAMVGFVPKETFGSRARKARLARDLTLQEVADRMQVARQRIWSIEEAGDQDHGFRWAQRLADAIGCSVEYLFGLEDA